MWLARVRLDLGLRFDSVCTPVMQCGLRFVEDFLWFALNPAYGVARFRADAIPWHKHWLGPVPVDYWFYGSLLLLLTWLSLEKRK